MFDDSVGNWWQSPYVLQAMCNGATIEACCEAARSHLLAAHFDALRELLKANSDIAWL